MHLHHYFRTILGGGLLLLADTYVSVLIARMIGLYAMLALHTGISLFSLITLQSSILSQLYQLKREMQFGISVYGRFVQILHYSIGAILFFIPGFVSSCIGVLLFTPPIRQLFLYILKKYAQDAIHRTYNQLRITAHTTGDTSDTQPPLV